MNIRNVETDLSSLFHLTYSFDPLQLVLTDIISNQKEMINKINSLENELAESNEKNKVLAQTVTQNKADADKKIKALEIVINNLRKSLSKGGATEIKTTTTTTTTQVKTTTNENNNTIQSEQKETENVAEESNHQEESEQHENQSDVKDSIPHDQTEEVQKEENDNNDDDNNNNSEIKSIHNQQQGTAPSYNTSNNNQQGYSSQGQGNVYTSQQQPPQQITNIINGGVPQEDFDALKKRVTNLEQQLNNFSTLYKPSGSGSGVSSEEYEMMKGTVQALNDKLEVLKDKNDVLSKDVDEMKIKVNDFNIYDLFKDATVEGGNLDASKLLVMNLERKVFAKFDLLDEKIKKDEEDIYKSKNDITNLKNQNSVDQLSIKNIKEDIAKLFELLKNISNENQTKLNELSDKENDDFKNLSNKLEALQNNLNDEINQINTRLQKLDGLEIPQQVQVSGEATLSKEDSELLGSVGKRVEYLEKNMKKLMLSIGQFDALQKELSRVKEDLCLKGSQEDIYDINDKVNQHALSINQLKDTSDQLIEDNTKMGNDINFTLKKLETMNSDVISLKKRNPENVDRSSVNETIKFLEIATFNDFIKTYAKEKDKINRDIEELQRYFDQLTELLKTKASDEDLKNLESMLLAKVDELRLICNKKFAEKIDTQKSIKYLDTQIKQIIEIYIKKSDKADNWLLAKKPLGGHLCASCEAYIGELNQKDDYLAWNKYPMREHEKGYRVGHGFSRMLNMLNLESKTEDGGEKKVMNSNSSLPTIKPRKQEDIAATGVNMTYDKIEEETIANNQSEPKVKYIIGRAQNKTDITLNDGTVSRLHAELDNSGSKITLKDLGSSNGTFVNRKQLPPQTSIDINLNEKITFGEFQHYLVVELLKEKDTSLYENINNHYKKHKRRHHSRHRRYHSNQSKKSDSSISSSVDYKNEDKSSVSSREYERNNKEDVVRHRKRKAKSRSRSKSKCKRNKVSSVIQNVKKEEMITKENERQIKLYNEYLLVKEMEMKNDRIEKLPKLIPKN